MHEITFLPNVIYLLLAAVIIVALFKKFHLSPVLGYFVAGALIGEHGWFHLLNSKDIEVFGELGIILLLFAIGLEMTFDRLKAMQVYIFGLGGLQVCITAGLITFALSYYVDIKAATIIAIGLALSSTAIVLQVLLEQKRQSTQIGRVSIAVLLMQDFAVVPILVLIPLLVSSTTTSLGAAMGSALTKGLLAFGVIFLVGRLLLRPMFDIIKPSFKSNDLFVASTLLVVLASAILTQKMGLSPGLGAFVAGLLVAETEYHLQAEESIAPFKGLLLGLFFMSVGMSFNIDFMVRRINDILLISALIIVVKFVIIYLLCRVFKLSKGHSIHAGLLLSQVGEFSFILFALASEKNIISNHVGNLLMIAITITMALTPLLSMIGSMISDYFGQKERMSYDDISTETGFIEKHVIVIGFGRVGKMVGKVLEAEKINYIAIDSNSNHVIHERKEGFPLYFGKGEDTKLLESVGIGQAKSIIITIDNEEAVRKCTKVIRKYTDHTPIIARARDFTNEKVLLRTGVTTLVPETYETGLQMAGAVLKSVGIGENEIIRIKSQFRLGNYIAAHHLEESDSND
jgi:CPA2 family monovalent cation:H+ antiporter-2